MGLLTSAMVMVHLASAPAAQSHPAEILKDINYAAEMCQALGERYFFKPEYITQTDFNGDQHYDYVVDMHGFDCGKQTEAMFTSSAGVPLYLYLSEGEGKWRKVFNGYVFEYRVKDVYGELPYFDVWIRGEVGYQINFVRHQWNGEEMEVIEQQLGTEVPTQMWKNFD